MNKRTKWILSLVGVCALVVPAALLLFLTSDKKPTKQESALTRQIDTKSVEEAVKRVPKKTVILPQPSPASPAASSSLSPGLGPESSGTPVTQ